MRHFERKKVHILFLQKEKLKRKNFQNETKKANI